MIDLIGQVDSPYIKMRGFPPIKSVQVRTERANLAKFDLEVIRIMGSLCAMWF